MQLDLSHLLLPHASWTKKEQVQRDRDKVNECFCIVSEDLSCAGMIPKCTVSKIQRHSWHRKAWLLTPIQCEDNKRTMQISSVKLQLKGCLMQKWVRLSSPSSFLVLFVSKNESTSSGNLITIYILLLYIYLLLLNIKTRHRLECVFICISAKLVV